MDPSSKVLERSHSFSQEFMAGGEAIVLGGPLQIRWEFARSKDAISKFREYRPRGVGRPPRYGHRTGAGVDCQRIDNEASRNRAFTAVTL